VRTDLERGVDVLQRLHLMAALIKNDAEQMLTVEMVGRSGENSPIDRRGRIQSASLMQRQSFGDEGIGVKGRRAWSLRITRRRPEGSVRCLRHETRAGIGLI
ncbi:MAG: hypothetical protein WBW35_16455, partial [Xanthobacteraceae bacterium]